MTYPVTQLAADAARRAGEAIQALQGRPRQIISKGFRDDVTDADFAAQEAIVAAIREHYPDHPIVSEENDFGHDMDAWQPPDGLWWLIDPLDGTTNYSRRIPHYCISVAVLEGETVLGGAIYDPVREHMFTAARGDGAALNGEPLTAAARDDLAAAVLEVGLGRGQDVRRRGLAIFAALATRVRTVRTHGAAALALAYVAAGWSDAYVHLTLRPWDSAAGVLMIQEAGGVVTLPDGSPWRLQNRQILASSRALNAPIVGVVQGALTDF